MAGVEWGIKLSYSSRTHPDNTTGTFSFTDCSSPTVLPLAQSSVLGRTHSSLFSSSCSHIIKCTLTRFPEALRCIQPGRLKVATFLGPMVKWRYLWLLDCNWNPNRCYLELVIQNAVKDHLSHWHNEGLSVYQICPRHYASPWLIQIKIRQSQEELADKWGRERSTRVKQHECRIRDKCRTLRGRASNPIWNGWDSSSEKKEGRVVKGQAFQEKRKIKAKGKERGAECCMPVTCCYCQHVKCVCMTGMATSHYLANRWGQVKEEGVSSVRSFILQTLGSQRRLWAGEGHNQFILLRDHSGKSVEKWVQEMRLKGKNS